MVYWQLQAQASRGKQEESWRNGTRDESILTLTSAQQARARSRSPPPPRTHTPCGIVRMRKRMRRRPLHLQTSCQLQTADRVAKQTFQVLTSINSPSSCVRREERSSLNNKRASRTIEGDPDYITGLSRLNAGRVDFNEETLPD